MSQDIRIVLVDDQSVFREALRGVLEREPDLTIVAEADNGLSGLRAVEEHKPDIVLMDISMPVMNGLEATKVISSKYPAVQVIILSMHSDETMIASSCQAGACFHLCKGCSPMEIVAAIKHNYRSVVATK